MEIFKLFNDTTDRLTAATAPARKLRDEAQAELDRLREIEAKLQARFDEAVRGMGAVNADLAEAVRGEKPTKAVHERARKFKDEVAYCEAELASCQVQAAEALDKLAERQRELEAVAGEAYLPIRREVEAALLEGYARLAHGYEAWAGSVQAFAAATCGDTGSLRLESKFEWHRWPLDGLRRVDSIRLRMGDLRTGKAS